MFFLDFYITACSKTSVWPDEEILLKSVHRTIDQGWSLGPSFKVDSLTLYDEIPYI
jgi:hypothetical protein